MHFNMRIAAKLRKWFTDTGVQLSSHRVLKSIYKAAWYENHSGLQVGQEPLKWAREYRSLVWWDTIQFLCSPHERYRLGLKQHRQGHIAAWEDVFCLVLGRHWRQERDRNTNLSDWMADCGSFMRAVCEKFGLWINEPVSSVVTVCPDIRFQEVCKADFSNIPELPTCQHDHFWDGFERRLWIQVDSKGISNIVNGDAVLQRINLECIFRRITTQLYKLHCHGWRPRRDIDNMVHWYRRSGNTVADHLCNAAMNANSSWVWRASSMFSDLASFKICVDGGLRGKHGEPNRPASLGCVIFLVVPGQDSPRPSFTSVLLAAQPVQKLSSAFLAEAMALEWSFSLFQSLF